MSNKNIVGNKIKQFRKQRKMTQVQLSELTGFKQNTISGHENGSRKVDEQDIRVYANALKINPSDLFDDSVEVLDIVKIPVVSRVSAGFPAYSEEDILEYTFIPSSLTKGNRTFFGLRVSGDSMNVEFNEGDVVIVEKDSVVENGQIGVVQVNGYNATVKRIKYNDDQIILLPESTNSIHLPQIYSINDDVTIIGRVISVQKFY